MKRIVACVVLSVAMAGCGGSSSDELEASQQRVAELEAELELQAAQQRVDELEAELEQAQESAIVPTTEAPSTTTTPPPSTTQEPEPVEERCESHTSPGVPVAFRSDPFGWTFERDVYEPLNVAEHEVYVNSIGGELQRKIDEGMIFGPENTLEQFVGGYLEPIAAEIERRRTSAWCVIDTNGALELLITDISSVAAGVTSTAALWKIDDFFVRFVTEIRQDNDCEGVNVSGWEQTRAQGWFDYGRWLRISGEILQEDSDLEVSLDPIAQESKLRLALCSTDTEGALDLLAADIGAVKAGVSNPILLEEIDQFYEALQAEIRGS